MALVNYDIDFNKLINFLLPSFLRKLVRGSWLFSLVIRWREIHAEFLNFRQKQVDTIKWNSQTIKLENLLIETFGAGIFITNHTRVTTPFILFPASDARNPKLRPASTELNPKISTVNFSDLEAVNFTVNVPVAIVFVQTEMEALIRKYNGVGRTFEIVTF